MRRLIASLLLLATASLSARAADLRFLRVWPQWHDADSFQSFYEYHTGHELISKHWTVLRSQEDDRGGLYFLVRVANPGEALKAATFVVHVISPESIDTHVFTFPTAVPSGSQLFEVGLTGRDWAGARIQPVAWEVELQAPDGRVLARQASFLWEKPGR
jgi:hypothetical protein